jgi:hypothetical protein
MTVMVSSAGIHIWASAQNDIVSFTPAFETGTDLAEAVYNAFDELRLWDYIPADDIEDINSQCRYETFVH